MTNEEYFHNQLDRLIRICKIQQNEIDDLRKQIAHNYELTRESVNLWACTVEERLDFIEKKLAYNDILGEE